MAEREDDKDVSQRYRELPHEEPPPALDARIRAEARRALETHAAPLVPPTGRRRWYFPVAAAAIIVLAVAVTTQVQREELEVKNEAVLQEKPKVAEQKPQPPAQTDALAKRSEPQAFAEKQKDRRAADAAAGARSRDDFSRENRERQERPAASPPAAAAPAPAAPPIAASEAAPQRQLNAEVASGALARNKAAEETPQAWLERIARLRSEGRHEDADKALAEFRKRYPDYRIPPEMLEKVEPKKAR